LHKNPAYPAAVEVYQSRVLSSAEFVCASASISTMSLNKIIQADRKRTWLAKDYGSFQSAWRTLEFIE
jgi:hypothetical protein